jgi:hypothetical protein
MTGDLTTRQRTALSALLEGQSQLAAAAAAGVGRQTIGRWMTETAFSAALRDGSDGAIRAAVARLSATADASIDAIEKVRDSPTQPGAAVKLRAADALLSQALKIREHADVLERLAALEARLDD